MEMIEISERHADMAGLIERATSGEDIILTRDGRPLVRLVPIEPALKPRIGGLMAGQVDKPRVGGQWAGKIWMSDDFDAPLPDEIMKPFLGLSD